MSLIKVSGGIRPEHLVGAGGVVGKLSGAVTKIASKGLGVGAIRGNLGDRILTKTALKHPAGEEFNLPPSHAYNFIDATPKQLAPGTKIYRVIDDASASNGGYWSDSVPSSKAQWRSGYAVLEDWNKNGKYVEYTVPEGGLNVWTGKAASQSLESAEGWIQPGGAEQIFVPGSKKQIPDTLLKLSTDWND